MGLFVKCHLKLHIDIILHNITLSSDFFLYFTTKTQKNCDLSATVLPISRKFRIMMQNGL